MEGFFDRPSDRDLMEALSSKESSELPADRDLMRSSAWRNPPLDVRIEN